MKKNLLAFFCAAMCTVAIAQPTTVTFSYTGSAQTFTVPPCVTSVTIEAKGAQGGAVTGQAPFPQGGLGATMRGDFVVAGGDVLTLVVGGRGNSDPSSSGGGGGSGVNRLGVALIVAGGGAGVDFQQPAYAGQNAVTTSAGVIGGGGGGAGGTGGTNGGDNIYSVTNISRGGNGWNIANNGSTGVAGVSPNTTWTLGTWGLGGGGGSVGSGYCNCGGGGGGYSGGGSGQINNSGGGGGSYNIGTNQLNTAGNNSGNGVITITYSVSAGVPATPGTITGSASVCVGSGTLVYSISPVATATSYTWTVPAGSTINSGQGTTSIVMQPGATSGNVTVTANNTCGSSSPATLALTIHALPTVTATAATPAICLGGSDVLTASGASTYSWSSGGTAATESVWPTMLTTYTVTGTDAFGCVNTGTVSVTVNGLPLVNLGSDFSQCAGTYTLDAQNGGSTYLWSDASTAQTLTVSTSGTYSVIVTDANGCSNSDAIIATINALPTVDLGLDVTQCGGSVILDAGNVGSTYLWNDASVNQTLTATVSGTYSVTVTDVNGCINSDAVSVTINSLPTVDLGLDVTQCGGSVTLDAGNAGSVYLWNDASTNQTLTTSSSGTYSVTVTDVNGCSNSDFVAVTINPIPTVTGNASATTVCLSDAAVTLTGTPAGGAWSGPGVTGSSFSPTTAGAGAQTTTYSYTDVNGCFNSATVIITVNACVGFEEHSLLDGISVYPNPNDGVFTLTVNSNVNDLQIVITDLQGRVVYSSNENNINAGYTQQINLQTETAGMYLMQISGNGQQRVEKITVQK